MIYIPLYYSNLMCLALHFLLLANANVDNAYGSLAMQ